MIKLESTWEEVTKDRASWKQWLALAKKKARWFFYYWSDKEGCETCKHYEPDNYWCDLVDLPNTFNPVLSPTAGVGMACMGAGAERTGQME